MATNHFTQLQAMGLTEAAHKSSPPSQKMVWLGLRVNIVDMTIAIPEAKMMEISNIIAAWGKKTEANIHELCTLLGKLFFMAQCCTPSLTVVAVYTPGLPSTPVS